METNNRTTEKLRELLKPLKIKVADLSTKYNVDKEIVARLMLHCNNETKVEKILKHWNDE